MGRWLTRHLAALGHSVEPIDTRTDDLDVLRPLDLVFVSVPISATPAVVRAVAPKMRRGAVLAEIASLKEASHATLEFAAAIGVKPLCVHPMFGPSTDALAGRVVAVVPVIDADAEGELTRSLFPGADVVVLSAGHHDRCMAAVLSLP